MSTTTATRCANRSAAHRWFEDHLPELSSRCRALVHSLRCGDVEEAMSEVLAQSFQYVLAAEPRGVLDRLTPFSLVSFFGRGYRTGRRMTGGKSTDVLSERGKRRHGRRVVSLHDSSGTEAKDAPGHLRLSEVLADSRADQPLENTRRNLDYPEILKHGNASRNARRVFSFLCETIGEGTQVDLARELGISPARVCQLKAKLADMLKARGYEPPPVWLSDGSGRGPGRPRARPKRKRRDVPLNVGTSPGRRME